MSLSSQQAPAAGLEYCWRILPHVSRTFALTIPSLREPLRSRVAVSYLLCRIADTIEDTPGLAPRRRQAYFDRFRKLVRDPASPDLRRRMAEGWPSQEPHHRDLIQNAGTVLDCYAAMDPETRDAVASCLHEMIQGMQRFPAPEGRRPPVEACPDLDTLEGYCHYVAGTVGILLSRLFARELPEGWLTPERQEEGRRFGLGLQLTNVIKDHGRDRERGVSYIPERWFSDRDRDALGGDGVHRLVTRALGHLDAAQDYILSLPSDRTDMRLFCLWAAHLAMATLRIAAGARGRAEPVKVSREELWRIVERARAHAADDRTLAAVHREYRASVERVLTS